MKLPAGPMAFSGGGIIRSSFLADIAGNAETHAAAVGAGFLPVWRGKPLVTEGNSLCWLSRHHPCLDEAAEEPLFLGMHGELPRFACDISAWRPKDAVPAELDGIQDRSEQFHPSAPDGSRFANLRSMMTALSNPDAELAAMAKALLSWHASHRFCAKCGSPSRSMAAGWQRQCGDCNAMHFPRTDPVVIMLVSTGNSILLGRAHGWPERMHSLLAGFMEPGETIEAAVRRETAEETGIEVGRVRYVASQPWPFPSSLMIGCTGLALGTEICLDRNELAAALWMTREEVLDIYANRESAVAPPRQGTIAENLIRRWLTGKISP